MSRVIVGGPTQEVGDDRGGRRTGPGAGDRPVRDRQQRVPADAEVCAGPVAASPVGDPAIPVEYDAHKLPEVATKSVAPILVRVRDSRVSALDVACRPPPEWLASRGPPGLVRQRISPIRPSTRRCWAYVG
jgi:hypothetical protein